MATIAGNKSELVNTLFKLLGIDQLRYVLDVKIHIGLGEAVTVTIEKFVTDENAELIVDREKGEIKKEVKHYYLTEIKEPEEIVEKLMQDD